MGSRGFHNGIRGTPSVSSRVGSKLPLPLYADVRFHIPMTHRNDAGTNVSFIHFVSCKIEDAAGVGSIARVSALITIPAVIRTFTTLISC